MSNPYKSDIGYVASRKNPLTLEYNILYDGKYTEHGQKNGRWILVCSKHDTVRHDYNKQHSISLLKQSNTWCDYCKNLTKMEEAELILTLRTNRETSEQLQRLAYFALNDPEKRVLFEELTGQVPEYYIRDAK